jgi:hypothetical protein
LCNASYIHVAYRRAAEVNRRAILLWHARRHWLAARTDQLSWSFITCMPPCQRRSALEFTRHTHGRKNCSVLCRLLDSSMNTFCATASLIYCVTGLRIWIFIPHMLPGSIDYIFRLSPHRFPPLEWPFLIFTKYKDMWMLLQPDES